MSIFRVGEVDDVGGGASLQATTGQGREEKKLSTAMSQEAEIGVKWKLQCVRRASQGRTRGGVG